MTYQMITCTTDQGVATVTLNVPKKLNCLNDGMISELRHALQKLDADDEVGAIILTGAGRAFCAGGDISEMMQTTHTVESAYAHMGGYHAFTRELVTLSKPVIAAVNGVAAGGGFSLAVLCDLIIASDTATFRSAFFNIALVPDLALIYNLTNMLGAQKTKEIIFVDLPLDAHEAQRLGLVCKVVAPETLQNDAFQLAKSLADGPRLMLKHAKKLIHMAADHTFETLLENEAQVQATCFTSEDHLIARQAFMGKTKPTFVGR
jgi:2-(1,2-epoxy-1,2-dihydrophenyl)acetyl-CoA isomerase